MTTPRREAPFALALLCVAALVGMIFYNVKILGSDVNHVPLVLATALVAGVAVLLLKQPWQEIEAGMLKAIQSALTPILILMAIGMVIAAWMQSGVVPQLIVYGLKLISPSVFLVTSFLVCCVVSLATGSSWLTAGSVGVALIAAGSTMGLHVGMVAGAIVSSSYFGDKMSPLSDTTNLAPAMAGATLAEHIKHMVWTVAPATVIALIGFVILGRGGTADPAALVNVDEVVATLERNFTLGPWLLIPPVLTLVLVMKRFPAVPALILGALLAVGIGVIGHAPQGRVHELGGYVGAMFGGYTAATGHPMVDDLLSRGGMGSMMTTVALVLCAMCFGGALVATGMLRSLTDAMLMLVRGTGSLIATTLATCLGVNIATSDQYMSIVVPGQMFKEAYLQRRLHPKNLSRALEDSGTMTSPLIPWNTCGQQMAAVLGVGAGLYWNYALLNLVVPVISLIYGLTGWTIVRISDEEAERRLSEV
jgi:NhaC family Na+:H+ antiporter